MPKEQTRVEQVEINNIAPLFQKSTFLIVANCQYFVQFKTVFPKVVKITVSLVVSLALLHEAMFQVPSVVVSKFYLFREYAKYLF